MSSIFTQGVYFRSLGKEIQAATIPGEKAVTQRIDQMANKVQQLLESIKTQDKWNGSGATGHITEFAGLSEEIRLLEASLADLNLRKKDSGLRTIITATRRALRDSLAGYAILRLEQSPVRKYPHLMVGMANLEGPLTSLWDKVEAAVLVSATLYTDGSSGNLTRWKLAIPKHRAEYLPSVYPSWVFSR